MINFFVQLVLCLAIKIIQSYSVYKFIYCYLTYQQGYCKYYSQGIVVFLVSNGHIESNLLTDYYLIGFHEVIEWHSDVHPIVLWKYTMCAQSKAGHKLLTDDYLTGYRVLGIVYLDQLSCARHTHISKHSKDI